MNELLSKVIKMSFSRKNLFKEINKKHDFHCNGYILCGMRAIDEALKKETVDDVFCNEYYKLKKNIENRNTYYHSIMLAILTGVIVSLALDAKDEIGFWGYCVVIAIGTAISVAISKLSISKQSCILEPYLLNKMEEKITNEKSIALSSKIK